MRIKLALALATAALLGACAQSPTASSSIVTAPRYDGGNGLGSGNVTGTGTGTGDSGTTTTTTTTTTGDNRGGNYYGSGG